MRPTIFGLRPWTLIRLYGWRLRRHPAQELFAGAGIAVGVALVFAVQVANTSITGSADQIVHGITGAADLQLAARSPDGFDARVAKEVSRLPGVRTSVSVLRARVALVGPKGRRAVELVGATPDIARLAGDLTRNFGEKGLRLSDGVVLPSNVADATGARSANSVRLLVNGSARRVPVGAVLGEDTIGGLAGARAAITPLPMAQRLTGYRDRVTHVLVDAEPGRVTDVRRGLQAIAGDRLDVAAADAELEVLHQAAEPNDQSTGLFAGISAMVGFLFAFNAMLVTAAERRRFVAELRMQGFSPRQVLVVLGFEALILGVGASLLGLLLGDVLSRAVFDEVPEYLVFAFPIGSQRVVETASIVIALGAGVLAALAASVRPVLDLRPGRAVDAVFHESGEPGEAIEGPSIRRLLIAGIALAAGTTALVAFDPDATMVGGVTLAITALALMPAVFCFSARQVERLSRRNRRTNMLALAMMEMQSTRMRSITLAAVGALAIYGSAAIGGARGDLVQGFDRHTTEWMSNADVWVTTGGKDLLTDAFHPRGRPGAVERAPGIREVRSHQGALRDTDGRRLWIVGRPPDDRVMVPPSQLLEGDHARATRRMRQGGWATVSDNIARSRGLEPGDAFELPTPAGTSRFRVAAVTTNLGWPPGTVALNTDDFSRSWRTTEPTALEVDLEPGVTPQQGKRAVERALGATPALEVQTRAEREAQYFELGRQGVTRLNQISVLLLIAAAFAVACALAATIWQRRPRLAALKIQGFDERQLWRSLLFETAFVVATGCFVGAVLGIYGHFLAGRYLELTTGFSAPFSLGGEQALVAAGLVSGIALAVSAVPGWAAAQVPMRASFQE